MLSVDGPKPKRMYPCRYCGKTFTKPSSTIKHERIHTGEKPFSCDFCGKRFAEKGNMKAHQSIHFCAKRLDMWKKNWYQRVVSLLYSEIGNMKGYQAIQIGYVKEKLISCLPLTLYSIIAPFDAFDISCIWKYYGKWSICSFWANAPLSIIFSKVFKT